MLVDDYVPLTQRFDHSHVREMHGTAQGADDVARPQPGVYAVFARRRAGGAAGGVAASFADRGRSTTGAAGFNPVISWMRASKAARCSRMSRCFSA